MSGNILRWGILVFVTAASLALVRADGRVSEWGAGVDAGRRDKLYTERGSTQLLIGQDLGSVLHYMQAFSAWPQGALHGSMVYTALRNEYGHLTGLTSPIDYGSGVQWAEGLRRCLIEDEWEEKIKDNDAKDFPLQQPVLQVGLWLVDQCAEIARGELDDHIRSLGEFLSSGNHWPGPVLLRVGYEFDSDLNHYDPVEYRDAFRRIASMIRAVDAQGRVRFVWHASGFPPRGGWDVSAWFPGRDVVDMCGVSVFQQPYDCTRAYESSNGSSSSSGSDSTHAGEMDRSVYGGGSTSHCMPYIHRMAAFCSGEQRGLPLMIGESTPFGGISVSAVHGGGGGVNRAGIEGDTWSRWFVPVLRMVHELDVRVWSYINADWDAQPMWRDEANHAPGVFWGDTRVEAAGPTFREKLWGRRVLQNPRFFRSGSAGDGGDGGSMGRTSGSTSSSVGSDNTSGSGRYSNAKRVRRCERAYAEAMQLIGSRSSSSNSNTSSTVPSWSSDTIIAVTNTARSSSINSSDYTIAPATVTTLVTLSDDVSRSLPIHLLFAIALVLVVVLMAGAVRLKTRGCVRSYHSSCAGSSCCSNSGGRGDGSSAGRIVSRSDYTPIP
jgi:hypothetical protein